MAANALISAAYDVARRVEQSAAERGFKFAAEQPSYGLGVEALKGEEWVDANDLCDEEKADVESVRLFDCDGERGCECRTAEELEAEFGRWADL